jgi:large subunit ribosomal protein L16
VHYILDDLLRHFNFMKQYPSRLKFRKNHRVRFSFFNLFAQKTCYPIFGCFALKSLEPGKLTFKQIEAGRKSIRRNVKKEGNILIRVFTSKSVTRKSLASRMGKGKGNHSFWMCPIRAGQIIYELNGVSKNISFKALRRAGNKLPFKTSVVKLNF